MRLAARVMGPRLGRAAALAAALALAGCNIDYTDAVDSGGNNASDNLSPGDQTARVLQTSVPGLAVARSDSSVDTSFNRLLDNLNDNLAPQTRRVDFVDRVNAVPAGRSDNTNAANTNTDTNTRAGNANGAGTGGIFNPGTGFGTGFAGAPSAGIGSNNTDTLGVGAGAGGTPNPGTGAGAGGIFNSGTGFGAGTSFGTGTGFGAGFGFRTAFAGARIATTGADNTDTLGVGAGAGATPNPGTGAGAGATPNPGTGAGAGATPNPGTGAGNTADAGNGLGANRPAAGNDTTAQNNRDRNTLRPTRLLLLAEPARLTPILRADPRAALDLAGILVYRDGDGDVGVAYDSADYLLARYRLDAARGAVNALGADLRTLAVAAAGNGVARRGGVADIATGDGIARRASGNDFATTVSRLRNAIVARGYDLVDTFDNRVQANRQGTTNPNTLLVFEIDSADAALLEANQTAGIDLPQRMLVTGDGNGAVTIYYNDPAYIARRHGISGRGDAVDALTDALRALAARAAGG